MPALTNLVYSEFSTTQANLLADIRTVLLTCASVSRPNAGSKPSAYKITTTRGADIVFDLEDAAITTQKLTIGSWRSYDGTTFTDKTQRYLYWKRTGGATTNTIYVIISVSKEHVFISLEGPRIAEAGADAANTGSLRNQFFVCDVVPYHAGDTTPVVFSGGASQDNTSADFSLSSHIGHVSRNYGNNQSWNTVRAMTLAFPYVGTGGAFNINRQTVGDGKYYLSPYVLFSDSDGLRGRLATFFHAGYIQPDTAVDTAGPPINSKVTYDSQTYKLLVLNKTVQDGNANSWNQLGAASNAANLRANVVAVPST